jgi:hypothetical protein
VQVPGFGDRFHAYQIADGRTQSIATIGKWYGTKPRFLPAGPSWKGGVPATAPGARRS